jgi:hypothetical protein
MKPILILMFLLFVSSLVVAQERETLQDEAAQAAWREDIDFLIEKLLDIHPDPFYRFPETELMAAGERLKTDLPFMTENEIIAELARIMAMLDGHTYLFMLQQQAGFHLYPIRLYAFEEGFYVVNAAPEYRDLIGTRLVSVNGLDTQAVFDILAPYSSTDNLYYLRLWVPLLMSMPELLQAVGLIADVEQPQYEFVDDAGERIIVDFKPGTVSQYLRWNQGSILELIGLPQQETSLYLSDKAESFWHTLLEDSQTLYVQYNHVYSSTASGLSISGLADVIEEASAEGEAERVVVDLRHNGGGDNTTYYPLLRALRDSDFNQPGRLFVIIGRYTFSAGKDFAMDVARDTEAIFVGEPTGGMPNNYGDNVMVTLPNSRIEVAIAARYTQKERAEDVYPWLAPELAVPVRAADFFTGRDAALKAILEYQP